MAISEIKKHCRPHLDYLTSACSLWEYTIQLEKIEKLKLKSPESLEIKDYESYKNSYKSRYLDKKKVKVKQQKQEEPRNLLREIPVPSGSFLRDDYTEALRTGITGTQILTSPSNVQYTSVSSGTISVSSNPWADEPEEATEDNDIPF